MCAMQTPELTNKQTFAARFLGFASSAAISIEKGVFICCYSVQIAYEAYSLIGNNNQNVYV